MATHINTAEPLQVGIAQGEEDGGRGVPGKEAVAPASKQHEEPGDRRCGQQVEGRNDRVAAPEPLEARVHEDNPRRLLVPHVAVHDRAGQHAPPRIGVEALIAAGRLDEGGQTKDQKRDDQRRPGPPGPRGQRLHRIRHEEGAGAPTDLYLTNQEIPRGLRIDLAATGGARLTSTGSPVSRYSASSHRPIQTNTA